MRKERNSLMSSLGLTRGSKSKIICHARPDRASGGCEGIFDSRLRRNDHKGKSETGRSMVEMLGVLAVIGVLSIGGIVGYNLAMSKHRVNELLDGASKRAIIVSTQMMLKASTNLDEFTDHNEIAGGTFSSTGTELDNNQFAILVDNVSKETCIGLIKSIGDKTPLRDITTQADTNTSLTAENCLDENNQLALIFNKDMENKATTDNEQSGGCTTPGSYRCNGDLVECCNGGSWKVHETCAAGSCDDSGNGYAGCT